MKTIAPSLFFCALVAAHASSWTVRATGMRNDTRSIKVIETTTLVFPYSLIPLGYSNGVVKLSISVDEAGKLTDCLVTAYTRPEFAAEVLDAMKKWKFEPAMVNGVPVPAVRDIVFNFQITGVVVSQTVTEHMEARFGRFEHETLSFRLRRFDELDRAPKPVRIVEPVCPPESIVNGSSDENVTIDFYIDERGHVRLPSVKEGKSMDLASAVVSALQQWEFEPPTYKGQPTVIHASQNFRCPR
ncbi:MAG TPA: TonB family protein [Opitutaceae bacterium]|nr:TonB family protein [Opitutaceae bacterium]